MRYVKAFIIGLLGDSLGLHSAFYISTVIALLAIPVVFFLPERDEQER